MPKEKSEKNLHTRKYYCPFSSVQKEEFTIITSFIIHFIFVRTGQFLRKCHSPVQKVESIVIPFCCRINRTREVNSDKFIDIYMLFLDESMMQKHLKRICHHLYSEKAAYNMKWWQTGCFSTVSVICVCCMLIVKCLHRAVSQASWIFIYFVLPRPYCHWLTAFSLCTVIGESCQSASGGWDAQSFPCPNLTV